MKKAIIDFAVWYSGMTTEKVERAYNRYLKEEKGFSFACGDCGQFLTEIRPGKYQCDNPNCTRNNKN